MVLGDSGSRGTGRLSYREQKVLSLLATETHEVVAARFGVSVDRIYHVERGAIETIHRFIRSAEKTGERLLLCVENALVVRDDRKWTPYDIHNDIVGWVESCDDTHVYIGGVSFTTQVPWHAIRAAWPRDEAPNPCPICGGTG